jgi:hypothetical protein
MGGAAARATAVGAAVAAGHLVRVIRGARNEVQPPLNGHPMNITPRSKRHKGGCGYAPAAGHAPLAAAGKGCMPRRWRPSPRRLQGHEEGQRCRRSNNVK